MRPAEDAVRRLRVGVPQDATRPHEQGHLAEVLAGALDDPAVRAHHDPRASGVAAQREGGRGRGDQLVLVAFGVGGRQEGRVRGPSYGGGAEVLVEQARLAPASQVLTALQRMPRSPSTVRVTGVVATTSRERPASSGSRRTTECTSVVAPPMSTTTTSAPVSRREHLDPGEHQVGRRAAHHRGEVGTRAEPLAADHVRRGTSRGSRGAPARARVRRSAAPRCR